MSADFNIAVLGRHHFNEFGRLETAVKTPPFALAEFDLAGRQGEQGVVLALADIAAGMKSGAALADDNHSAFDGLAIVDFDSQALGVGIAPQPRRTARFFMRHGIKLEFKFL